MKLGGILETALYCDDLDAAEAFYGDVLGLERLGARPGRHVFFRCGDGILLLFNPEHTGRVETAVGDVAIPLHGSHGPGHAAFRVTEAEVGDWRQHLGDRGIEIEADIEWPRGGRSIYFRDPAGNSLEIASPELWGP